MTKQELLAKLAELNNCTKVQAEVFLENFKAAVNVELCNGNEVKLGNDFGTFKPVKRNGVIIGTQKPYSSKGVKFQISANFKRVLNA